MFRQSSHTRFLTYMVQKTIKHLLPFTLFFAGQILVLASVFTLTTNQGEEFLKQDSGFEERGSLGASFLHTLDFAMAKDDYKFKSFTGQIAQTIGILYLNIIVLNLVIALVGDVYDNIMSVKKETELKLKAEMLKELYDFKVSFPCFFPQS
jgi:hypothetical protein